MTLLIWGEVQNLHRSQDSQVLADLEIIKFKRVEVVRVIKRL